MNRIGEDCLYLVLFFLDYESLKIFGNVFEKLKKDCENVISSRVKVIENSFILFLSRKEKRKQFLYQNISELYRFKPFVVQQILDNSSSYHSYNDKRKFVRYIFMIARRHEIEFDDNQFRKLELVSISNDNIYDKIKLALKSLDISLLMYLR